MSTYQDFADWFKRMKQSHPEVSDEKLKAVFVKQYGEPEPERVPVIDTIQGDSMPSHQPVTATDNSIAKAGETMQELSELPAAPVLKDAMLRNGADFAGFGGDIANAGARLAGNNEYSSPVDSESIKAKLAEMGLLKDERDNMILDTVLSLLSPAKMGGKVAEWGCLLLKTPLLTAPKKPCSLPVSPILNLQMNHWSRSGAKDG